MAAADACATCVLLITMVVIGKLGGGPVGTNQEVVKLMLVCIEGIAPKLVEGITNVLRPMS